MTDGRDEGDDRHLKAVDDSLPATSGDASSSSGSPLAADESGDSSASGGRTSSSEGPPETPSGGADGASGESVGSDSESVEPSESERLRSVGDESASDEADSESEGLRVVEDDEVDPVARERDELRETLQRVQAEFENFRKRTMRDQSAQLERATDGLIEQLLPVLDSFELAALSVPEGDLDEASAKLRKGVELVYAELLGVLEKTGLERIDALGHAFDPEQHEAVMREGEGQTVTEVMRTGYRLKGRVLRPAMVKVGDSEGSD